MFISVVRASSPALAKPQNVNVKMHNYTYTYGHATNGNALTRVSGLSVDCNAVSPIAIKFDVRWRHAEMLNSGTTFKDSWSGGYENVSGHFG